MYHRRVVTMTCVIVLRAWEACQGRSPLPRALVPTEENLVSLVLCEAKCASYKAHSPMSQEGQEK